MRLYAWSRIEQTSGGLAALGRELVLRRVALLVLAGMALGAVVAAAVSRVLDPSLYGVERGDPLTLLGVGGLLIGVSFAAALIPLRRAIRVSPATVLSE